MNNRPDLIVGILIGITIGIVIAAIVGVLDMDDTRQRDQLYPPPTLYQPIVEVREDRP